MILSGINEFWPLVVEVLRLDLLGATLLAVLYGGAVGLEREIHGKAAGLRTNILICVGATLFTQLSIQMVSGVTSDPTRIAAQIVSGVGFLGAGTILQSRGHITGLTSAATIWVVAAIGVALGAGAWIEATGVTIIILLVLGGMGRVEQWVKSRSQVTRLSVELRGDSTVETVEHVVGEIGMQLLETLVETTPDGTRIAHVSVRGPQRQQDLLRLSLLRATGAYRVSEE